MIQNEEEIKFLEECQPGPGVREVIDLSIAKERADVCLGEQLLLVLGKESNLVDKYNGFITQKQQDQIQRSQSRIDRNKKFPPPPKAPDSVRAKSMKRKRTKREAIPPQVARGRNPVAKQNGGGGMHRKIVYFD